MILIGLAGQARCGKGTVADYLVRRFGFVKFAFSDALYHEISQAFGVSIEFLKGESKDVPSALLALKNCSDSDFVGVAFGLVAGENPDTFGPLEEIPNSPRRILQWWGTDYRRAQQENYWIYKAQQFLDAVHDAAKYPEQRQQYFVEEGTRFENERGWIKSFDGGNIWHIHREGVNAPGQGHVSAAPLPILPGERQLWNNDTVERLYGGVNLLIDTGAEFVRVEPALPMATPFQAPDTPEIEADRACQYFKVVPAIEDDDQLTPIVTHYPQTEPSDPESRLMTASDVIDGPTAER